MHFKFYLFCAAMVAVAVVFSVPQAQAADPAAKCESAKVKVMGKYVACLTKAAPGNYLTPITGRGVATPRLYPF